MNVFLFDSHSLEALADELSTQICLDGGGLFSPSTIVIPHPSMKEWLQLELCKRSQNGAIIGLEFTSPRQIFQNFFKNIPSRTEIAAAIWVSFAENPPEECKFFLQSEKKSIDFVSHLASLFLEYSEYGLPKGETVSWQKKLFQEIFTAHGWATYADALNQSQLPSQQLYFFAIDLMPPSALQFFLRVENAKFFRFSPCAMFWEDLCSNREQKKILRKLERKNTSRVQLDALDALLRDSQPLLANWATAPRKMLTVAPEVTAENYELEESNTQLCQLKLDLLLSEQLRRESAADSSIRCLQVGSSKMEEVQILREEILKLQIPFSEIRIYAPDIESYASLIEFCFKDIPYRIAGVDLTKQSPFARALQTLFSCVNGRWSAKEILSLFEMSSFTRKIRWSREAVAKIRDWIERSKVRWGLDQEQRGVLSGTWEAGFETLFNSWIYFQPEKEYSLNWSDSELFEEFYETFDSLRRKFSLWHKQQLTLREWAEEVDAFCEQYLFMDERSDADLSAQKSFFQTLESLRIAPFPIEQFPFAFVEAFFFSSMSSDVGGSALQALRFNSLEIGTILPAKAIFIIGMDEESFPRASVYSSLKLPTDCPSRSEQDRYAFLSAIFAAKERLIFSYCHRSSEDGKQVSPSLLIQELFGYLKEAKEESITWKPFVNRPENHSLLQSNEELPKPVPISQVSLQELSRFLKSPFQYYLKTVLGIELRDETESAWEEFEFSSLTQHLVLRAFLEGTSIPEPEMPLGLFGEMAEKELNDQKLAFSTALNEWGIRSDSIGQEPVDLVVNGVKVTGEAHLSVPNGALHMGGNSIASLMRRWVEILSILTTKGTKEIYFLKTGHVKTVADPLKALEGVVSLYIQCQNSPLFLHPDWADSLLRKGVAPEADTSEDRVMEWVLSRSPNLDLAAEKNLWHKTLTDAFSTLASLYPTRGSHATV